MLTVGLMLLWLRATDSGLTAQEKALIEQIADSGRCANVAEPPDKRIKPEAPIAPGTAPLLSFRYYEGKMHHRYGNVDLMLDDAGH